MEKDQDSSKNSQMNQSNQNSDSESEHDSESIKNSNLMNSIKLNKIDLNKTTREIEVLPENTKKSDLSFKIIIIGDSYVGKSSLAYKAIKNTFDTVYSATLGFDYFSFFVRIENKILKLQILDTCGQEIYQSLIRNFYSNSSLAIMVYSIDNRESFVHIDNWLKEIKINSNPNAKIFLIGNKNDLNDKREISYEEGLKYAEDMEFSKFLECSALTGFNAQKIFLEAANVLFDDFNEYKSHYSMDTSTISESMERGQILNKTNETKNAVKGKPKKECC